MLYNNQLYEALRRFHTDKVMVFTDPKDAPLLMKRFD